VEEGGTGGKAAVPGYRVAGKTGTAKVATAGGYGKDYVGTFVGFAPVSNPRFVMAVIINEPKGGAYYGGSVAGPDFSQKL
jgi:Cell division protein FtsI/penicillin-binding protein 2